MPKKNSPGTIASRPLCQAILQTIPFQRNAAARALGVLAGHRIRAVVNGASVRLDLREAIQRQMFLGAYEPTQTAWCKKCLEPGDVFIDVGASFGYYTTLGAALVGPAGVVFAFEPSPVANQVMEESIAESMLHNVVLVKAAVSRKNGSVPLLMPTTPHLHSPSIFPSDPRFIPVSVPAVELDRFAPLEHYAAIKLVKIDVEGCEPDVLAGMEQLLAHKRIKNIICEFNSGWLRRNSTTPQKLLEQFLDFGFRVREQTGLEKNLAGYRGEPYDLQDFWFSMRDG